MNQRLPGEVAADVRTLAKGGSIQIAGQLVQAGLGFLFVAVAVRMLGAGGYGVYKELFQIVMVGSMVAVGGFQWSAVYFVSRARASGDHAGARGAVRVSLAGALVGSGLVLAVIFVWLDPLASAFAGPGGEGAALRRLLQMGAAAIPLLAVMHVLRFSTHSYRTMVPSVVAGNIVQPAARVGLTIIALAAGYGVGGAVGSVVAGAALGMLTAAWFYRRMLTPEERRAKPRLEIASTVRFALPQAGVNLLNIQSLGLGVILLGLFGSHRDVGLFGVAAILQTAGTVFLTAVLNIWSPIVSDLYERGDISRLGSLYQTLNRWVATLSFPVYTVLMLESDLFVRILAGQNGADAAQLVPILAVGNLFYAGTGPCSQVLSMTGRPGLNFINSAASVALYAGAGMWAAPRYGAVGVAVVDAAVTALVNLVRVAEGWILLGLHPFSRAFVKPVLATLTLAAFLLVWADVFRDGTLLELTGLLGAAAVYLALLIAMGLSSEERDVFSHFRARAMGAARGTIR